MTIEYWPGTNIMKSRNNGFTLGFGEPVNWVPMQVNATRAAKLSGNDNKPFEIKARRSVSKGGRR